MVDRYERLSGLISGIYRQIQKLEREEMEKYGFKGAFAQYLLAMNHHPEGLTAAQLCDACDKDKAAVSRVLAEMEELGFGVSRDEMQSFSDALDLTIKQTEQAIYALAGEEFNINSTKQLGHILFEKLSLPHFKKTRKEAEGQSP